MADLIKPFYDVPNDEERSTLFEAKEATISQGDEQYKGRRRSPSIGSR